MMTPVGLMIGPLNKWLRESVEPAEDCADVILEVLRQNGYAVVCTTCGKHWTEYCGCARSQAEEVPR